MSPWAIKSTARPGLLTRMYECTFLVSLDDHGVVNPRRTINLSRSVRISRREPSNHHPPATRDLHDCRAGTGAVFPACHGRRGFGCIDVGDGGRNVRISNSREDGGRHAVLSKQSSDAGRLRQMRAHDGLRDQMLRRPSHSRILFVFCSFRANCPATK